MPQCRIMSHPYLPILGQHIYARGHAYNLRLRSDVHIISLRRTAFLRQSGQKSRRKHQAITSNSDEVFIVRLRRMLIFQGIKAFLD
ncbi:hypothetical protein CGGC5_v002660 [Colletotrichum fructicola Nara gc5]|uniref:Uncharacterized protein n=1 Tax=Colletotrichum fructicola (strain Nara gc5) TaxID=1213859 RepID=A0A7J6IH33_COLFN|nr:hypothetical protein CGGC5_v015511 [Colletotrichum fructicola Nara gc5]KAF4491408.1 hypothetical protein CGGC5_v002660 [Colletotrichum fructicola Nara gc5]